MTPKAPLTRQALSDQQLEEALDTCAQEKIHIPGAIQPHGYMVVLDKDFKILKVSENLSEIFEGSAWQFLGKDLRVIIDEPNAIKELKGLTSEGALNPIRSMILKVNSHETIRYFDAIIHKSNDMFILEMEPHDKVTDNLRYQNFYNDVTRFSVHLQKIDDQDTLYDYLVTEIRRITGLARVKLYKFDADWNGLVIAESKEAHMPSYLGLSFPHSDIPKQARALYAKNYLRLIPNVEYNPVKIIPNDMATDGEPLNLSFSVLRSVSPVHMQYLANMNIQASMSISIMQNDKLWGLIACHHHEPYYVPYPVRMAAEMIGHTFSAFLSNFVQTDETVQSIERQSLINELSGILSPNTNLMDVLKTKYELILDAVKANGMIIFIDGKHFAFGLIPEISFSKKLITWLEKNHDEQIFSSASISRDTNFAVAGQALASGVLAVPVSTSMKDYIIWFRCEQKEDIYWAGKPEKHITENDVGYHLTPRASFTRWKESVHGFSKPWCKSEIEAGKNIAKLLLAKKYEDLLRQKNEDLQSIMNNSSALIYICDIEGRILSMNDSALHAFNIEENNIKGQTFNEIFDGDLSTVFDVSHSTVLFNQKSMTFENDFIHNGKEFHLISVKFPLYSVDGDIYALCTMATDISSLRKTESDLKQSNKELEHMAFIASHDLQEPLRHIANFTQRLNEDYRDTLDSTAHQYIDFTLGAIKRMKNLIYDLLQYSQLNHENETPSFIDPNSSLDQIIKEFEFMHKNENIEIKRPKKLPAIQMLPEHFSCIIQNLIGNALKYQDKKRPAKIEITVDDQKFKSVFCVEDNGIGIKKEYFDKVFMIFQRLHTSSEYEGTGIGLALVKRILDKYNGSLWLQSEYGVGSRFYFSLPKDQPKNRDK